MWRMRAMPAAPSWFVVLPDRAAAATAAERLGVHAPARLNHPSGRPWLLGRWPAGSLAVGAVGRTAVAVLGQHAVTAAALERVAARVRTGADLDRFAATLIGSSHLLASIDGAVRAQGTATGIRRLYTARVDGATCAADRADVLAWLTGAALDEQRLATHLLEPPILYPVAGSPVWQGVEAVSTDHHVVLADDGGVRLTRWWHPPPAERPLADGAAALRDALCAAVDVRIGGRSLTSADLGGVDSTAVCCVAARTVATVAAFTAASPDPLGDDVAWAARTAAAVPAIEHHVIPADQMPLVYAGLTRFDDALDEPCSVTVDGHRWLTIADRAVARGSDLHLVGFGGDELLYGSVAHVHDALRRRPREAAGHLRGFAAKYRWPRRRVLAQLADRRSYRQWLADAADAVGNPAPPPDEPLLAWGFEPRVPPWTTRAAAAAVRDRIQAAAACVEPPTARHGGLRELETMRFVSRLTRQFSQMAASRGLTMAAPYYDDRVVEAALSVRPLERVTPWAYKPLIHAAMRGIVPDAGLARATKANGTVDEEPGLRRHRGQVQALWRDSRLAALGIVDADALHDACAGPLPAHLAAGVLYQTIACEVWLRSLEAATGGPPPAAPAGVSASAPSTVAGDP